MAEDVICLLDYVGWTAEKDVHVVGISLGGMIAQGELFGCAIRFKLKGGMIELALRIPERIGSLTLAVTTPGGRVWNNLPPVRGVFLFIYIFAIID